MQSNVVETSQSGIFYDTLTAGTIKAVRKAEKAAREVVKEIRFPLNWKRVKAKQENVMNLT